MASRIGMSYRNEAAQARLREALTTVAAGAEADMPPPPEGRRDPALAATIQLEWMADVLERVAGGTVSDTRELETLAARVIELETALAKSGGAGKPGERPTGTVKRGG